MIFSKKIHNNKTKKETKIQSKFIEYHDKIFFFNNQSIIYNYVVLNTTHTQFRFLDFFLLHFYLSYRKMVFIY